MDISDSESINLNNAISILNSEGEKSTPYTLTIKNICDTEADYQVNLETLNVSNKLADKYVTLKVNNEENKVLNTYEETTGIIKDKVSAYKLYEGHLKKNQVMSFEIRMWIGEEVEATDETLNKGFQSKVTIEATVNNKDEEYKEDILNGADPVLKEDLIPVTINDKGEVYRANLKEAWYNYADKKWANAVILEDGITEPVIGAKIEEEQIESYFVWIPKYSYQLWDLGEYDGLTEIDETKPHTIPIRFGINDTSNEVKGECTTPMSEDRSQGLSEVSNNCKKGDFMTHPAFISFDVNGFWVGKFETGYKDATDTKSAEVDPETKEDSGVEASENVIIKPDSYSWRNIKLANAFNVSYSYKRELDSHMIKNTEWGAVAYLTNSIYGTCTQEGCKEIAKNNVSDYKTGYAAEEGQLWNTELGNLASTTQNITGIYDMSGGTWEMTFGVSESPDGHLLTQSSGFNGKNGRNDEIISNEIEFPEEKYYDVYHNITSNTLSAYFFNKRILGDATGELGPFFKKAADKYISSWYNDGSIFTSWVQPFFIRGDSFSELNNAGIMTFDRYSGRTVDYIGFRIVLAPKQG